MIKAAFFDVDSTLFDHDAQTVPQSTIDGLVLLRQRGVKLFIASGRPPMMLPFLEEYFPFDGFLAFNGQYCYTRDGKLLHKMAIPQADIRLLLSILEKDPFNCLLLEREKAFLPKGVDPTLPNSHFREMGLPLPQMYDPRRLEAHPIYQFLIYGREDSLNYIKPLSHVAATSAGGTIYDIIPKAGGKQVGIAAVAEQYGIRQDEVMVFGDGRNDVEMITWAGIGVAMGNGHEAAKAAADYVTTSVREDGIWNALLQLGLISPHENGRALPLSAL